MTDPDQDRLAERVREALAGQHVREVPMFGGMSFMVDGSIAVAARRGGELLVRVDPGRHDELLHRPGAVTARMGQRDMGQGWLQVGRDGTESDEALRAWVDVALSR